MNESSWEMWQVIATLVVGFLSLVGTIVLIAWKAGVFQGTTESAAVQNERLHERITQVKKDFTEIINGLETRMRENDQRRDRDFQDLREFVLVNRNDIDHLKAFRSELGAMLRELENEIRGGRHERSRSR